MTDNAVALREEHDLTQTPTDPVARLFALADTLSPDALERMVALAERVQDRQSAIAMQDAHAAFQAECPPIAHNDKAKIATKSGASYTYTYATLDHIARTISPVLNAHGLSYTWDSGIDPQAGLIHCTCTLRHVGGGSRTATFTAPMESDAKMSGAQKAASALTYAKRQSLIQVLGLTTADSDNDGAGRSQPQPEATLTAKQVADIEAMLEEIGDPDQKGRILSWANVGSLDQIPAGSFASIIATLEKRRAS